MLLKVEFSSSEVRDRTTRVRLNVPLVLRPEIGLVLPNGDYAQKTQNGDGRLPHFSFTSPYHFTDSRR
jgi:hypothetical protein